MADMNAGTPAYTRANTGSTAAGILLGGALAGVLGGIIMGIVATLWGVATVAGPLAPWQAIAGTFFGPMSFVGDAGVTAIGVLTHLSIAGFWGVVFAAITVKARSAGRLFGLGILYGIAVWALMTYVIAPVFDATMAARIPMMFIFWFFLHWVYGAFTGLFTPTLRRAFGGSAYYARRMRQSPV